MARGRKVDSDGEVTKRLLLDIAIEQFAEYGYHATKISEIVKKANVTQPTFYLYFKSKEVIFQEITKIFQKQLINLTSESLLEEYIEEKSLKKEIQSGLTNIFTFFLENPLLTQIGFYEAESAREMKKNMVEQITENLETEKKLGYFSEDYPMNLVAESLVGSIERLTLNEILTGSSSPADIAKVLVDVYFSGIQKK
ncbi:TetR/AcrR family transcriptional regulator [Psychrobacillus sp. FJAT-51614]|uniref:TetR/AcrR family transcriptional regulator n=1 Tax=Psychrobacillus mangrovi TaxID=3117745 RepID=A0ABU8F1N3_9BACI